MKTKQAELLTSLKSNPDNSFFLNLVQLLDLKLGLIKDQLVRSMDDGETKRLQGRAMELTDLLVDLKRKPVKTQHTGAFS